MTGKVPPDGGTSSYRELAVLLATRVLAALLALTLLVLLSLVLGLLTLVLGLLTLLILAALLLVLLATLVVLLIGHGWITP
ncbi:MAG TPA: hypothetical protein PKB01_00840 [Xanthobacteraceae bacterium]|nr:hypothetical protein [Xanthobacteraceae bacterium]